MEEYILKTREDGTQITLRDVQMKTMEILLEFDRICKANDIDYALAYGTALGAVRHQGFIPWDDDVDVLVDYENYDKLLVALKKDLKEPYYYHCFETDVRYNVLIPNMKFRLGGTRVEEVNTLLRNKCDGDGLFIDVFIVDSVTENTFNYYLNRVYMFMLMPILVLIDNIGINPVRFKRYFVNRARRHAEKHKNSNYTSVNMAWTFEKFMDQRVTKDIMNPKIDVLFEGHMLPIPNGYHEFLMSMYGPNYMQKPPLAQQKPKHIEDIEI